MNKTYLASVITSLILSAGLISCSKEKSQPKDVYNPPAPEIVDAGGNRPFGQWKVDVSKNLDLHGALDFTSTAAARIEIVSDCQKGELTFNAKFEFKKNVVRPVRLLEILPEQLMALDFASAKVVCNFRVTLFNTAGSARVYSIGTTPIVDLQKPEVHLERAGSDAPITLVKKETLEGVRVRYQNTENATAQVICQDMKLPALNFSRVVELNDFDLKQIEVFQPRPYDVLQENPIQKCRIVVSQAGSGVAISDRFWLQLPSRPLQTEVRMIPQPSANEFSLIAGHPLVLAQVKITNPNQVSERFVAIPKAAQNATMEFYVPVHLTGYTQEGLRGLQNIGTGRLSVYQRSWLFANPVPTVQNKVEERQADWVVTLPPKSEYIFEMVLRPNAPMVCENTTSLFAVGYMVASFRLNVVEALAPNAGIQDIPIVAVRTQASAGPAYIPPPVVLTPRVPCTWGN